MSTPVITPVDQGRNSLAYANPASRLSGSSQSAVPPGSDDQDEAALILTESLTFNAIASMMTAQSASLASPGINAVLYGGDRATEVLSQEALVGKAPARGGAAEIRYADEVARELAQPITTDPLAAPTRGSHRGDVQARLEGVRSAESQSVDDRGDPSSKHGRHPHTNDAQDRSAGRQSDRALSTAAHETAGQAAFDGHALVSSEAGPDAGASGAGAQIVASGSTGGDARGAGAVSNLFAPLAGTGSVQGASGSNASQQITAAAALSNGQASGHGQGASIGAFATTGGAGASLAKPAGADDGGVYRGAPSAQSAESDQLEAQVVRGLSGVLRNGGGSVHLTLRPTHLGSLGIELNFAEGGVAATLRPTTHVAHDLLLSSQAQLHAALEARGTRVDSIVIEMPAETGERLPTGEARHDRIDPRTNDRGADRSGEHVGEQEDDRTLAQDGHGDARGDRGDRSSEQGRGASRSSEDPTAQPDQPSGMERGAPRLSEHDPDRQILGVDVVA